MIFRIGSVVLASVILLWPHGINDIRVIREEIQLILVRNGNPITVLIDTIFFCVYIYLALSISK